MANDDNGSNDDDPQDFMERWYQSNANAARIGGTLADLTRRLMRASINADHSQLYEASNELATFLKFVSYSQGVTTHDIVTEAVERLTVTEDYDSPNWPMTSLAQDATRYLLEKSSTDGFASARLSKRQSDLRQAIQDYEEERRWRLERRREKR